MHTCITQRRISICTVYTASHFFQTMYIGEVFIYRVNSTSRMLCVFMTLLDSRRRFPQTLIVIVCMANFGNLVEASVIVKRTCALASLYRSLLSKLIFDLVMGWDHLLNIDQLRQISTLKDIYLNSPGSILGLLLII